MISPPRDKGKPTVIDLYCGAGGFSEGFRQAGFRIIGGFDVWGAARKSFEVNQGVHCGAGVESIAAEDLERPDVLIGGPPCAEFSSANNGGSGEVELGLVHVRKFLELVEALDPDYWVFENVPRLGKILSDAENGPGLDLPSGTRFVILNAQDFGVPQRRYRLFVGKFPTEYLDDLTVRQVRTMRTVVEGLPDYKLLAAPGVVTDPMYGLALHGKAFTDHLSMDRFVELNPIQKQRNIDLKQNRGYYGKMEFPDNLDAPSRTVMATQFPCSRETIVIRNPTLPGRLRRLTIRECACLQGFPLSYQFFGGSAAARYRLVGNAVPVGLSRAVATTIKMHMNQANPLPVEPTLNYPSELAPPLQLHARPRFYPGTTFKWPMPKSNRFACRVEFDNLGRRPYWLGESFRHCCEWRASLHVGVGRDSMRKCHPPILAVARSLREAGLPLRVTSPFLRDVQKFHGRIPDASALQWAHMTANPWRPAVSREGVLTPRALLHELDCLCDRHFGRAEFASLRVRCRDSIPIAPKQGLPLQTLVRYFALFWACREVNSCRAWMIRNPDARRAQETGARHAGLRFRRTLNCPGVRSAGFPQRI